MGSDDEIDKLFAEIKKEIRKISPDEELSRLKRRIQNREYDGNLQRFISLAARLGTETYYEARWMFFPTSISHQHIGKNYIEYCVQEFNVFFNFENTSPPQLTHIGYFWPGFYEQRYRDSKILKTGKIKESLVGELIQFKLLREKLQNQFDLKPLNEIIMERRRQ